MIQVFSHRTHIDQRTGETRVVFNSEIGEALTYEEAWGIICNHDLASARCLLIAYKHDWETFHLDSRFPNFEWPENINFIYFTDEATSPVIPPSEYTEISVQELIRILKLPYRLENTEDTNC